MCYSKPLRNQPNIYKYNFRNYHPCGSCGKHCDSNESLILNCGICDKYYHRSCAKMSKIKYRNLIQNKNTFVCSERCYLNTLPLSKCNNIDIFCAIYGEYEYPCSKCKRDCKPREFTKYLQYWSGLSVREFLHDVYYFCSRKCEVYVLPFTSVDTTSLIKASIFNKSAGVNRIPKPKSLKKKSSSKSKPSTKRGKSKPRRNCSDSWQSKSMLTVPNELKKNS